MGTTIESNGSKWAGEKPDSIEKLLELLDREPLDRTFEAYGNFAYVLTRDQWLDPETEYARKHTGHARFFGNFYELSHVFNITTDEPEVIERLTQAIRRNQQRPDYLAQEMPSERETRETVERTERDRIRDEKKREQLERELAALNSRH